MATGADESSVPSAACSSGVIVRAVADRSHDEVRVFGLTAQERLERIFERATLPKIDPEDLDRHRDDRVLVLCSDYIVDERVVAALAAQTIDVVLHATTPNGRELIGAVGSGGAIQRVLPLLGPKIEDSEVLGDVAETSTSGSLAEVERRDDPRLPGGDFKSVDASDLVPAFDPKLRKQSAPLIVPVDAIDVAKIERLVFDASYKGTTDFVTKWVWPRPARAVTRWCAARRITPNSVTALSYVLTAVTFIAFWQGHFATGLVSAWGMTFLDTVDGKLARVTLTSSRLGDVLDHGLDLVHPPFWWIAWAAGLAGASSLFVESGSSAAVFGEYASWAAVLFFGYIVGRLLEGIFILRFGQEMFNWRPFDRAFRLVIARRNPNLVLLTIGTLLGIPDQALIWVGVWTLACILIQCVRIAQAWFADAADSDLSNA